MQGMPERIILRRNNAMPSSLNAQKSGIEEKNSIPLPSNNY
jgi:hypothetical protein